MRIHIRPVHQFSLILCLFAALMMSISGLAQSTQQRAARSRPPERGALPAMAAAAVQQGKYEQALQNLKWREIGPAIMGGRTDDFAVVESNPSIVYAGTASGGVWKTINGGNTWEPVFDNESVSTIGDVTVSQMDPSNVWVGSGEQNNRQSSSWGNGVYKSTDAGKTWTNMGLKDSHHIGRIVIHPSNPSVVYVAAVGRLWGPNGERGVYKTTDGGKTCNRVLFINEDTGVVDLAMDLQSPDTLYAAAYQRRRTAYGYNGGGPHSALYKTTDGGATWKKLTKGLPYEQGGETGRIGVAVYRRNSNIVYTLVEHAHGGIFRSDDKGETWTKMSDTNPRPSYYSQIHIDPNNDQRVWVLAAPMSYSEDGGKTFRTNLVQRIHGDYHAMWINPANSDHMIVGSDGGIHWSYDRGRTWEYVNTLALGQFYELGVDMRKPYYVCGGLQDNGSWCGPSATWYQQGITNEDWYRIGGGDGFYAQIDPSDYNNVYTESQDGNVLRRDLRTNESRSIRPEPKEGEPRYRFQWNSPIVISLHNPKTIYYGGNFLFKSTDRGDSWVKLGGDLTTGVERDKLPIMGKVPDKDTLSRHDGVQAYPTITTVAESASRPGVLWVGTDDGNLQVTRDDGKPWKNVVEKVPGVPKGTYVSRVAASRQAEGTAYVTFDGHRSNDFNVYAFMTTDYGETWKSVSRGLPADGGTLHVIREHPRNPNLLFAGAEFGAYVSWDRGASWTRLKGNLPTVPVDDIVIHPRDNDLIFGTHGRSVWVLDDITALQQLDDKVLSSDAHLFDIRPAIAWRMYGNKGSTGHKMFIAQNPPYGALINFYLKAKPAENERVRITISDKEGRTVREINCAERRPGQAVPQIGPGAGGGGGGGFGFAQAQLPCEPKIGINRVNWDLHYATPVEVTSEQAAAAAEAAAAGFFGGPRGPMVEPGEYTVKLTVGRNEVSKTVSVEEDPRITISAADRAARRQALTQLYELSRRADQGRRTVVSLRTSLTNTLEAWKRPGGPRVSDDIQKAAEALSKQLDEIHGKFVPPQQAQGAAGPPLQYTPPPFSNRIGQLMNAIDSYTAAPTAGQMETLNVVARMLTETLDRLKKLTDEDLANLNKMMNEAGVPHIRSEAPAGPPAQRRRGR